MLFATAGCGTMNKNGYRNPAAMDEIDFSEENIKKANIKKRYKNNDFEICMKEIIKDIENKKV